MSQREAMQAYDAEIMEVFLEEGIADEASYKATSASVAVPCHVMVDRAVVVYGDVGEVVGTRTDITLMRSEIPTPVRAATVTVDGSVFKLEGKIREDESFSRWAAL